MYEILEFIFSYFPKLYIYFYLPVSSHFLISIYSSCLPMCLVVGVSVELVMGLEYIPFFLLVKGNSGYIYVTVYTVENNLLFAPIPLNCLIINSALYVIIFSAIILK